MLPVFAAGVGACPPDLACEALVDDAAEPCLVELREVDAGDHRPADGSDELAKEELRWLAPDGLNMLKPGGVHAVLAPRRNIGEVVVAENDARDPLLAQRRQLLAEVRFHLGPGGRDGAEADPDRRPLRFQHLDPGGVEANTPSGRVVERDEAGDGKPTLAPAGQSQRAVLAPPPHHAIPAAHVSATRTIQCRPPASR